MLPTWTQQPELGAKNRKEGRREQNRNEGVKVEGWGGSVGEEEGKG